MTALINEFVNRVEFDSYEDFRDNFRINVPENFNFAYDVVDRYAEIEPDKVALVWCNDHGEEKRITFGELRDLSSRAANFFTKEGIQKGDTVMLTLKARYDFWYALLGLHRIGAIAIPATHMLKEKDIVYRIREADIKMVVCIAEDGVPEVFEGAIAELGSDTRRVLVGDTDRDGWINLRKEIMKLPADFERPEACAGGDDTLIVYFSSGTTGMPKMIEHDHTYPLGHIITAKYWQNVREDGLHYTVADTGWAKAMWGQIYGQWIAGSAVFVYDYDRFDPEKMLEKLEKYEITTFCAPPTIYRFLIKEDLSRYDLSGIEYAVTAGEPLNPEVFERFREHTGLQLMEGFGQTECVVCIANFPWMEPKPGSMGKPSPGYPVELVDRNGDPVDVGEEGEIVIRTAEGKPLGLFNGYYRNPEKTSEVWHDGYYHTGDTAWMDEDGYMWFVGRTDDIIKSSGYRIGPFEVESAIISHPSVLECAVTGYPDPIRGQVVKATIVLARGYEPSEELKKEIQDHVKRVTAPYKYPRIVEFVDELPKTISGKIRRVEIREHDLEGDGENP
ncbi:AMP-binding protein [Methanothermobacter thermautotrophicus]|jgi:acetyl-CoA synthetase|nr:AMP-binding protein [Methanothermobacter thermautotrophicus]WBF06939.1 AMP-binding protein [Methanothermobacter thermautotrophicus]HIH64572.1 AMP-binding protein [Methanothermobacter thermautotrophicus]HIH71550.1 AMP-binding protein [Methanothermobacter thermautotrophicus]